MQKINGSGRRRPDWPLLLEVYLDRARDTPFAWGLHDCATFAIGWVELAREDLKPAEDLFTMLGYNSASGALDAMGGRDLATIVDGWGYLTQVQPAFAQRGDLVLVETGGRLSLGVCAGDVAAGPGTVGLELLPMTAVHAAWRV